MNNSHEAKSARSPKSVNIMICVACVVLFIYVSLTVYTILNSYDHYFYRTWRIIAVIFSLGLTFFTSRQRLYNRINNRSSGHLMLQ